MVDALHRARRLVTPAGCVVDLHPTAEPAVVEAGGQDIGGVEHGDASARHAAADAAVAAVVDAGLFAVDRTTVFTFFTYGDTIEELGAYIEANWRHAMIDEATMTRARDALREFPGVRPRVRERVRLTTLRVIAAAVPVRPPGIAP